MKQKSLMDTNLDKAKEENHSIEEMPLTSFREYRLYNKEARRINHAALKLKYKIKQCPIELHPSQRIHFNRNDQPTNMLPVYLSEEDIHYDEKWIPGKTYTVPELVINYVASKGTPIYDWVDKADGSRETDEVAKNNRFSLRTVFNEA